MLYIQVFRLYRYTMEVLTKMPDDGLFALFQTISSHDEPWLNDFWAAIIITKPSLKHESKPMIGPWLSPMNQPKRQIHPAGHGGITLPMRQAPSLICCSPDRPGVVRPLWCIALRGEASAGVTPGARPWDRNQVELCKHVWTIILYNN